ncbi:rRNA maturation RNase YbeY [Streptococcaceae bacterium ESL0687]|nr:rRNA maturation RNase YbeY [Streptococcaceae bacterium ESL0687]
MYVEMLDETGQVSKEMQEDVVKLLGSAAQKLDLSEEKEMMITFVDNEKIREINHYYRDKDAPTDVVSLEYKPEEISFGEDFDLDGFEDFDSSELMNEFDSYIGELYISVDKAHEQAEEYGHSFEREMGFLAVHGFLHINGYDHYTPEDEKEMFGLQEEILTAHGLKR